MGRGSGGVNGVEKPFWTRLAAWRLGGRKLRPVSWAGSVSRDLGGLSICRLIGGLDKHGLGDVLAGRHGHLLDLVQLLEDNKARGSLRFPPADGSMSHSQRHVQNCDEGERGKVQQVGDRPPRPILILPLPDSSISLWSSRD